MSMVVWVGALLVLEVGETFLRVGEVGEMFLRVGEVGDLEC